jgi:glycosyltransferase involved in cell wall biosynthesis
LCGDRGPPRMKILRSVHTLDPAVGGPIESVRQSSAALARRGHQVEIVCLDPPNDSRIAGFPVPVHALGPGRGSYAYAPRLTEWIKERAGDFDIVIIHGLWQYSGLGAWLALRNTTTPYVVFPHGMLDPWFKQTYPLKHLKKLFYWLGAERRILRDAAAVLFTSEEERRLAEKSFPFFRGNKVVVNYGTAGPDVDLEAARREFLTTFPLLRGQRFLLFLGRLHEKKGCDLLIEAFAAVRKMAPPHLVIAGPCADEVYRLSLKKMAEGMPITFAGMLSGNVKWGAFAAADAFVLPSHQENFGIAVAESLACETPVLISNKVNIWREIVADEAGFTDEDDLAGTARLLERWLRTSEAERQSMRANARKCFERRFEIEQATSSLLSILERVRRAK